MSDRHKEETQESVAEIPRRPGFQGRSHRDVPTLQARYTSYHRKSHQSRAIPDSQEVERSAKRMGQGDAPIWRNTAIKKPLQQSMLAST